MKTSWDKIFEFNNDPNVNQLRNLYATPSWFEVLGVDRIEALHSNFIAWLLGNRGLWLNQSDNAISRLIDVLIKNNQRQKATLIDANLIGSVASKEMIVRTIDIDNKFAHKGREKDNHIGLIVSCDVSVNNEDKELVLYIKNKVEAKETINETGDDFHTHAYYRQFHDGNKSNRIQLFVFLSPDSDTRGVCNHFIRITYNDLLHYVLEPILTIQTSCTHEKDLINEYIRSLGTQVMIHQDMGSVLAISDEEKKTYTEIYNRYKALFIAAIAAVVSERYKKSHPETKSWWKNKLEQCGQRFSDNPDEQLVAFWKENRALIKNTIVLSAPEKDKTELLKIVSVILKKRVEYTITYNDKKLRTNRGHLAACIVESYIWLNNLKEYDVDRLKQFFNNIRNPFIVVNEPEIQRQYDKVKLGTRIIWIPNNCWPAGGRQFQRLLEKADQIEGLTIE